MTTDQEHMYLSLQQYKLWGTWECCRVQKQKPKYSNASLHVNWHTICSMNWNNQAQEHIHVHSTSVSVMLMLFLFLSGQKEWRVGGWWQMRREEEVKWEEWEDEDEEGQEDKENTE